MSLERALVVDEDPSVRDQLSNILSREGLQVSLVDSGRPALSLLRQELYHVLLADVRLPDMDGLVVLRQAMQIAPRLSVVVLSGQAALDSCIEAFRLGALDYVIKPFAPEAIRQALARASRNCQCQFRRIDIPSVSSTRGVRLPDSGVGLEKQLVARSPAMQEVSVAVAKVAHSDAPVLIRGEAGAGKDQVAQVIHGLSGRANRPFVHVACGALRETVIEARLFGRKNEGFSQDARICRGFLQCAQGGTILLADVENLPLWAQIELAAIFQDGFLTGDGDGRPSPLDLRLLASTSCDLEAALSQRTFDRRLYYLLNVVTIRVPPLRERREDLRPLIKHILAQTLAKQNASLKEPGPSFTPEAWERLLNYSWPGNLPELANVVGHALAFARGAEIGPEVLDLPALPSSVSQGERISVPLTGSLDDIERAVVEEVIRRCNGNKAAAARALVLHRRTLYRILKHNSATRRSPAEGERD